MIRGLHGMFYTSKEDDARTFMRDKLKLPFTDVGGGWLIFDLPESDIGLHPTEGQPPSGTHDLSFFCDDIEGTVKDLKSRGVEFDGGIDDHGYGFVTHLRMPGDIRVQLYEPKYAKRNQTWGAGAKAAKARGKPAAKAAPKKAAVKAKPQKRTAAKRATVKKPAKKAKGRR